MIRKNYLTGILTATGIALYFIIRCATPLEPASSATKADIILESSALERDDDFIEDSLGKSIRIGISSFLPENIDSVHLEVTTPLRQIILDTVFRFESTDLSDTLWYTITFLQPGSKNIILTPFSELDLKPVRANVYIHNRDLPENPPPAIIVSGNRTIRPEETCSLTVVAEDDDTAQTVTVKVVRVADSSAVFENGLYTWTAPGGFAGEDTFYIIATDNGFPPASDTSLVIVRVTANPHSPTLSITGDRTLTPSSTCVLVIRHADEDSGQSVRTTVSGNPEGSSILDSMLFIWDIPEDFSGSDTIIFTTTDDGTPPRSVSDTVIIIVSVDVGNYPPVWQTDTISISLSDRESVDIDLAEYCSDADGDDLQFSLADTVPPGDFIDGSHYRYSPEQGTDTTCCIPVTASDPNGATAVCLLSVTVQAVVIDNDPPVLSYVEPSSDSSSVNESTISVTIAAVDASGIGAVACSMGENSFEVSRTDSFYTAIITGLEQDHFNRIVFTAEDGSENRNNNSIILYINYDPTMEDHTRPVLRRSDPVRDSLSVSSATVDVAISATDISGIASVVCRMGTAAFEVANTESSYRATVSGLAAGSYNRIVFTVTDASTNANSDSIVYYVNYDPTMNDHSAPVLARQTPDRDTSTTASSAATVSFSATDENGISSAVCTMGENEFALSGNGEGGYSAEIPGLAEGTFNRIVFVITDASTNRNRDSIIYHIFYDPTLNDHTSPSLAPHFPETLDASVSSSSLAASITATDDNGIGSVTCSMNGTAFTVENSGASVYSANVSGLVENQNNAVTFIATDGSANANEGTITYTIFYDPTLDDNTPPVLTRENPITPFTTTASPDIPLTITATDQSGISSIICAMGSTSFSVTNSGQSYSATATGLTANQNNLIKFIATDASSNANRDSIMFTVYYDQTLGDHQPPTITPYEWPTSNSTVVSRTVTLDFSVSDDNGLDSVWWSINEAVQPRLTAVSGDHYSLTATLEHEAPNPIVVYAADHSTNHNQGSTSPLVLNFNRPPAALDQEDSTLRATPQEVTLAASDPDGDAISQWKVIAGPYNGTITSDRPTFTYTPTGNYEGPDSLTFRIWDSFGDSSVAVGTVRIAVEKHDIAPRFTVQPGNAEVDSSGSVTFSAIINNDVYPSPEFIWYKDGQVVFRSTQSSSFSINPVRYGHAGIYAIAVTNRADSVNSDRFTLTVNDVTDPELNMNGQSDLTILLNEPWSDPGATALDDRDGDITGRIVTTGTVTTETVGRDTITYTVNDNAGNSSTAIRIVRVEGWIKKTGFEVIQNPPYATVMTEKNRYYIAYMAAGEQPIVATFEDGKFTPLPQLPFEPGEYPTALSLALGSDNETIYLAYYYNQSQGMMCAVKRWDGLSWSTVINNSLPVDWEKQNLLNLTVKPDNTPYIAGSFRPENDAFCAVMRMSSGKWEFVGPLNPIPFDGTFGTGVLTGDKNVVCVASDNTPYVSGNNAETGKPVAMKFVDEAWVPAAGQADLPVPMTSPDNIHLLEAPSGELYFGCTFTTAAPTLDPRIFRLAGNEWQELFPPFARNPGLGLGGFSMTFSPDNMLYAVHPEDDDFIIRRWDGIRWFNIPEPLPMNDPAFIADCSGVSIAAGNDECYVTFITTPQGARPRITIMHWKRQ